MCCALKCLPFELIPGRFVNEILKFKLSNSYVSWGLEGCDSV